MRLMSFSMTTEAVRNRSKTVTRRVGWRDLQPGTLLQAVEKAQGLKKGEHVKPLGVIRVVDVRREYIGRICSPVYDHHETEREGFPGLSRGEFVEMFCRANGCGLGTIVTRIEFEYVDPEPVQ